MKSLDVHFSELPLECKVVMAASSLKEFDEQVERLKTVRAQFELIANPNSRVPADEHPHTAHQP